MLVPIAPSYTTTRSFTVCRKSAIGPQESVLLCKSRSHMHERRSRMDRRGLNSKGVSKLAPVHHFCGSAAVHVGLIEYNVGSHVCWPGGQHLLLAHHEIGSVETRQFESVSVRDSVGRTGLDTVSAKNAAVVVDVIDLGVT